MPSRGNAQPDVVVTQKEKESRSSLHDHTPLDEESMSDAAAATTTTNDALPLTEQMRLATRQAHAISDKLVNLKLVVALTNKTVYGQSLLLFYYVFAQIEQSVEARKDHEVIKPIHAAFKPLVRADVIKKDLDFYLGDDWSKKFAPPPAVVAYVKRIKEVEKEDPVLLLAYTYHMYMALLFGGQMIKKMVKRSFSVEGESGLETFEFGGKSKMALRSSLKDALNGLDLEEEPKSRLLQESIRVFKMNNEVVRGIEGMFKQFMLWIMKWIIVIQLIYWTYWLFIHGK